MEGYRRDSGVIQWAMDSLQQWAETWGLTFKVSKCKVMHTGKKNPGF